VNHTVKHLFVAGAYRQQPQVFDDLSDTWTKLVRVDDSSELTTAM
jgi:hypothetical protein